MKRAALPANGNTEALWMVRPLQPGDRIDRGDRQSAERSEPAARRRARWRRSRTTSRRRSAAPTLQYERAVSEAKRTGKSQEVDGVTLVGRRRGRREDRRRIARHDRRRRSTSRRITFEIDSSIAAGAVDAGARSPARSRVIAMPSNTFRDGDTNIERYRGGADAGVPGTSGGARGAEARRSRISR